MVINVVNRIIREYLNDKKQYERIKHNMLWYRDYHVNELHDNTLTTRQAFAYAIQSALDVCEAKPSEYDAVIATLWQTLESKNYSLIRLW